MLVRSPWKLGEITPHDLMAINLDFVLLLIDIVVLKPVDSFYQQAYLGYNSHVCPSAHKWLILKMLQFGKDTIVYPRPKFPFPNN